MSKQGRLQVSTKARIGLLELLVGEEFAKAVREHGLVRELPRSGGIAKGASLRPRLSV